MRYKLTITIGADDANKDLEENLEQVLVPSVEGILERSDYRIESVALSKEYNCPQCGSVCLGRTVQEALGYFLKR